MALRHRDDRVLGKVFEDLEERTLTPGLFAELLMALAAAVPFSSTSWIRSRKRNAAVGGGTSSYHLQGLAADVILDDPKDKGLLKALCTRVGLQMIDEGDHLHLEPR